VKNIHVPEKIFMNVTQNLCKSLSLASMQRLKERIKER